jgi:hypothetical protein
MVIEWVAKGSLISLIDGDYTLQAMGPWGA